MSECIDNRAHALSLYIQCLQQDYIIYIANTLEIPQY